tara:strand:- start:939 stop:1619 length:681 start_codon:yes stop_codon:yes gene_type:complete
MLVQRLGAGVDGEVWLYKKGNTKLAIKYPKNPGTVKLLKQEKEFMEHVSKTVSQKCKKYFPKVRNIPTGIPEKEGMYAMTYIEGKTFSEYIRVLSTGLLRHKLMLKSIIKQIKEAFKCLWKAGIIHGDAHFGNIIITPKYTIKVIDFGFAGKVEKWNPKINYEDWFIKQWPKIEKKWGIGPLNPNIMIFGNGKWRKKISVLHPIIHQRVNKLYSISRKVSASCVHQ